MAANYVLLERIELNASAASVTFSNIPQSGYTDLKIVMSGRLTTSGYDSTPWVIGDISLNSTVITTGKLLYGTGSAAGSDGNPYAAFISDTDATANTFSSMDMYLPNYMSSTNKSVSVDVVTENNGTAALAGLQAILSTVTSPVTSITIGAHVSGAFAQYSTFSLYGLAAVGTTPVIAPKASGGNITTDGTYWIHTFNTTGAFVPQTTLSCDYLVIAGGGGGGNRGGGGGAGGYLTGSSLTLASGTSYTATVGAGGTGGTINGAAGSNSIFSSITSTGGGFGAAPTWGGGVGSGGNGGSGGGAGSQGAAGGTASPSGQGNNGGAGYNPAPYSTGGGGGAGAAGATGTSSTSGAGGNGLASSITGTSVTRAGGGGGGGVYNTGGGGTATFGAGGTGGGGAGGNTKFTVGTAGTTNTGSGGGGGGLDGDTGQGSDGGNGGSGIVIIRYPIA